MKWFSFITWLGLAAVLLVGCSLPASSVQESGATVKENQITSASGVAFDPSLHRVATFQMW